MVTKQEIKNALNPKAAAKHARKAAFMSVTTLLWDKPMGERLRYARECVKRDQTDFGHLLNMTQQAVSKLEHGRTRMHDISLGVLSSVLGQVLFNHVVYGDPVKDDSKYHPSYFRQAFQRRQGNRWRRPGGTHISKPRGKKHGYLPET